MKGRPQIEAILEDSAAFPSDPIQSFSSSPNRPLPTAFTARQSSLRPQPSRATSHNKDTDGGFVPTGLLGGRQDEAGPSNLEQACTPSKSQNGTFRSNGLLDDIPAQLDASDDDDDEAMPDIRQILQEDRERRTKADRHKKLLAAKLQYVQNTSRTENHADDSDLEVVDDDMHTVAKEEEKDRRLRKARHLDESVGRQKQLTHAGKASLIRSPTKSTAMRGGKHDIQILAAAAIPSFSAEVQSKTRKGKEREKSKISKSDLDRLLLHHSEKQSRELTAQKEAEFYRKVGQRRSELPEVDKAEVLEMVVRKGLDSRNRDASSDGDDEDQDDEENDGDWVPDSQREASDDENEEPSKIPDENELPIATDEDYEPTDEAEENDENDENIPFRVHRTTARPRAVLDSDSDNDAENHPPATGQLLVAATSAILGPYPHPEDLIPGLSHRGSMSSFDERLEDGTDKENDSRLMFDRGEDKENTAVASQSTSVVVSPLAALRGGSGIFSLQSLVRSDSFSSGGDPDTTLLSEERAPLKDIATGDDEDAFFSPSAKPPVRVRSPRSPIPLPSQPLSPLRFRSPGGKSKGLGALFNDDEAGERKTVENDATFSLEPAAVIRSGGLSQFFAASAKEPSLASPAPLQLGKAGDGFSQFMTPVKVGLRYIAI
jgi:mediator of replication checkpoint protein 1